MEHYPLHSCYLVFGFELSWLNSPDTALISGTGFFATTASSVQTAGLKYRVPAPFSSRGSLHVSHWDSDQRSEPLQRLPNAFQNLFCFDYKESEALPFCLPLAPLITFALTHGMSEEFTAGMELGSFPRAITESWVTFTLSHKVYHTALAAVERVCSRVVLKTLGKHKIMALGGEPLWVHCLSLKYTKQWQFYCSMKY